MDRGCVLAVYPIGLAEVVAAMAANAQGGGIAKASEPEQQQEV
jgi:hypothetical protein